MCGLCGFIGIRLEPKEQRTRLNVLTGLIVANQSRGDQSAGVSFIDKGENILIKRAIKPIDFVRSNEYQDLITINDFPIAIAHDRLAVIGEVNDKNAQPFNFGKITGTHNGIINNHLEIDSKREVDSEVLFSELNKANNDYKSVCSRLSGSIASVWHCTDKPGAVYLVRHDNPLSLAYVKSIQSWFWSSESDTLQSLLSSHYGPKDFQVHKIKENKVYCIRPSGKITKENVSFKASPIIQYGSDGRAVHQYNNSYNYGMEGYGYEKYEDESFEEAHAAEWVLYAAENEGCHQCGKPIPVDSVIYYDDREYNAYCTQCGKVIPGLKILE